MENQSNPTMRRGTPFEKEDTQWRLRDVRWKQVWRRQDHASLLLTLALVIAVGIISFVIEPREDEFYIYDATISYPAANKRGFDPTVPVWAAIILPLLLMLLTIVVGEFFYSKREHHVFTDALAVTLYFLLDAIQSFFCTLLVTQATKVSVGVLRPDFLDRCAPVPPNTVTIQYGQDTRFLYPCTGDSSDIKDGRQSFPSGHASVSFNLAVYASGYLIWCWNVRREWMPRCMGPMQEFLADLGNVMAKVWMLIMLALPWGIAMSRMIDNQHHPSDVIAGMVLGSLIAVMYILRAIPRYPRVLTRKVPCTMLQGSDTSDVAAAASEEQGAREHSVHSETLNNGGMRLV